MNCLIHYLKRKNIFRELEGKEPYNYKDVTQLSDTDVSEILESLECDLEPEVLFQDGEASMSQVKQQETYLRNVHAELQVASKRFLELNN